MPLAHVLAGMASQISYSEEAPIIVFKTSTKSPRHGKTNRAKVQRVSPELNGKTASAHRGGRRKACCPFLSSFCGFRLRNFGNRLRDSLWLVFQRQVRLRHNSNAIPFSVYYGNPTKLVFLHGAFAFLHVLAVTASHRIYADELFDRRVSRI